MEFDTKHRKNLTYQPIPKLKVAFALKSEIEDGFCFESCSSKGSFFQELHHLHDQLCPNGSSVIRSDPVQGICEIQSDPVQSV
ncbi:unnamed protein product [Camellia sinensis]